MPQTEVQERDGRYYFTDDDYKLELANARETVNGIEGTLRIDLLTQNLFVDTPQLSQKTRREAIAKSLQDRGHPITEIHLRKLEEGVIKFLAAQPKPQNGRVYITPSNLPPVPAVPEFFPLTDYGNAERLTAGHGKEIHYCSAWGKWLTWDGRHWEIDETGNIWRRAKQTIRMIYREAAQHLDSQVRKATADWAKSSEARNRIEAMVSLTESELDIGQRPDTFDADAWLFNVQNGTVNLRTGNLQAHDPADLLIKLTPVDFEPSATCPTFDKFLNQILPDEEVRKYIQKIVGYSLTGDTREQQINLWHGSGANGKSTLLGAILGILGDYGRQMAPDLLVIKKYDEHPTALADLFGARLAATVEIGEGKKLAEVLVKQMTGGERMKARFMKHDFFEWTPTHKIVLVANHKPIIIGADDGIWRRIDLVPFTITIPESERDKTLPERLRAEYPGILNWAIRGCLDWQAEGLGRPKTIQVANEEYRAEMDVLGSFIIDRCVTKPNCRVTVADLYEAYETWCQANKEISISKKEMTRRLAERGIAGSTEGHNKTRIYVGIGLVVPGTPTQAEMNLPDDKPKPPVGENADRCGHDSRLPHEDFRSSDKLETLSASVRNDIILTPTSGDWCLLTNADGTLAAAGEISVLEIVEKDGQEFIRYDFNGQTAYWPAEQCEPLPPQPANPCPVCLNATWYWQDGWQCRVCALEEV